MEPAPTIAYRIQSTDPTGYFARKLLHAGAPSWLTTPGIPMLFIMDKRCWKPSSSGVWQSAALSNKTNYAGFVQFYRDLIHLAEISTASAWAYRSEHHLTCRG